jgi:membrane protease YdiL (CAAX protease family)
MLDAPPVSRRSWFQFFREETYQIAAAATILLIVQRILPAKTYNDPVDAPESSTFAIVWGPVLEEVLYRGILENILRLACKRFTFPYKKWAPTAIASTYFGYKHFGNYPADKLWLNLENVWQATGLGVYASAETQRTRSLFKAIIIHGLSNAVEVNLLSLNSKFYYRLYMMALNVATVVIIFYFGRKAYRENECRPNNLSP